MTLPACVEVADITQVGEVRRLAAQVSERAALGDTERGAVAIAATELATNLSRYAPGGRMIVQAIAVAGREWVEIIACDKGPGMADVDRCVRDGYSTGGTVGAGLGAVKRLASEFDIYSAVGRGTVVVARVGPRGGLAPSGGFRWAGVVTAAPHESTSGDAWRVAERDGEVVVMVADGLGHGPQAAAASTLAAEAFSRHAFDGPAQFCDRAHETLAGSRGAAIALAHVRPNGAVSYAGVGNISGSLISPGHSRGLMSQNGTAGFQMRPARSIEYAWPEEGCLVMHSDGLTSRWSLETYPGLLRRHPAVIASVLHRDCLRGRDDATVVVLGKAPRA